MKKFSKWLCAACICILLVIAVTGCVDKKGTPSEIAKSTKISQAKISTSSKTTSKSTASQQTDGNANIPVNPQDDTNLMEDEENTDIPFEDGSDIITADDGPFAGYKFDAGKIDGKGRTFVCWLNINPPVAGLSPSDDRLLAMKAKTEEKFNVKIDIVKTAWWAQQPSIATNWLSGIKWTDFFTPNTEHIYPWALTKNFVLPVDDYVDYSHLRYAKAIDINKWIDGKHYSFLDTPDMFQPLQWYGVTFYNEDILNKEGLQDIQELFKSGQWNWEKFREYAISSTRDFNGDGVIDQWGIAESGPGTQTCLYHMLKYSNNATEGFLDNGTFRYTGLNRQYVNALQFYQLLKFTDKTITAEADWTKSKVMMILHASITANTYTLAKLPFRMAPLPVGPDSRPDQMVIAGKKEWVVPAISDFTPEEIITIGTYLMYNDPSDPEIYQDKYELFCMYSTIPGWFYMPEREVDFFYNYISNLKVSNIDLLLGRDFQILYTKEIVTKITSGQNISAVIDSARPIVDSFINSLFD